MPTPNPSPNPNLEPSLSPNPPTPPKRKVSSDPFPGFASAYDVARSYARHKLSGGTEENDPDSLYSLRETLLAMPLRIFQTLWPEEDGFKHYSAGPIEHDIEYTEVLENGEEATVTIPWENTCFYEADRPDRTPQCFALYAMPPAVANSEPEDADLPWGRGLNHAAMDAAERRLEEIIRLIQDVGYQGVPAARDYYDGYADGCLTLVAMGLEMSVGLYKTATGLECHARGPAVREEDTLKGDEPDAVLQQRLRRPFKGTNSPSARQPGQGLTEEHKFFADPFPGVADREAVLESYYRYKYAENPENPEDDPDSLYYTWELALSTPALLFGNAWKETLG